MSGEEPKVVAGAEDDGDRSLLGGKAGQLRDMFAPDSIAVVGASPNPRRIGSRVLANLRRHGFAGRVHVVNPRYPQVDGLRTLSSLSELPEVPDLTLFAVDADTSLELLAELGSLGGRNAVLLASGFESGPDGARRLRRLTELSDRHELRVVGPNSQGLWSVGHRMVLAFGSEAGRERVFAGPVAVVAHSGSLGGAVTRQLLDIGVGVSYFVSTGDGAVLDTADYLRQVIEDPSVRVVALYLEGTRDGRHLRSAVREAARRGIRVVALAGGLTAAGRATTASHTGRMITRPRLLTDLLCPARRRRHRVHARVRRCRSHSRHRAAIVAGETTYRGRGNLRRHAGSAGGRLRGACRDRHVLRFHSGSTTGSATALHRPAEPGRPHRLGGRGRVAARRGRRRGFGRPRCRRVDRRPGQPRLRPGGPQRGPVRHVGRSIRQARRVHPLGSAAGTRHRRGA